MAAADAPAAEDEAGRMETSRSGETVVVRALGRWTIENAAQLEIALDRFLAERDEGAAVRFDLSSTTELDTYGVWLIERARRSSQAAGATTSLGTLNDDQKRLFDEIAKTNLEPNGPPLRAGAPWHEAIALRVSAAASGLATFLALLGAVLSALWRSLRHPRQFRMTSLVHHFEKVAWDALPIVLLVTFIIGVIIAQQGFFHFRSFGADLYVVDMIGFLVMRELGVLLVAIMVAGRSGSAFTAELGSMKMREEVDALRTMGLDPVAVLVVPRTLSIIFALTLLAFIGSMAALFGSALVAVFYAGLSPELFLDRLREAISMDHLKVGLIKAPFFGAAIGIIACTEGFRVRGSVASLGKHTTSSVVKSIFAVIALDGLFALFFTGIGM